ncbi:PREDICTED: uncharacterized protein LOC105462524 [Wasmannia auropunctata]|uniref:uncharacterized protein LOC105462524 n=1 Tax=Wasmannia auropunctata TaxID=64793 RepID=UPI0005EF0FB4|nr:PREDICTED: uncharacterized protein LOC105462524 [Wasmannia auropunctata]
MAVATVGQVPSTFTIEPFNSTVTNLSRWLLRLEAAFRIFSIKDESRVPYLFHYVGPTPFDVLCDRLAPLSPFETTYDTLITTLKEFYDPPPLEIAENFKFYQRKQKDGESIQEFLAALQKLSIHCKFGDYLKTALRNQLVFGVATKRIQARLLEIPDLTLEKATQVAATMEMSEKEAQELQGEMEVGLIHSAKRSTRRTNNPDKLNKPNSTYSSNVRKSNNKSNFVKHKKDTYSSSNTITCYRCGDNHLATKCTLNKNVKCNACGRAGHLQKVCFQRKREANAVSEILQVEHVQFRDKISTTLAVNDKEVKFEIDSGAAVSLMSESLALIHQ